MTKRKRESDDSDADEAPEAEIDRKERKRRKKETKKDKKEKKKLKRKSKDKSPTAEDETTPVADPSSAEQQQQPPSSSVLRRKKLELTVSLLPSCLANVEKSVNESLCQGLLLQYSDGVDGVVLAFDQVEIERNGTILDDMPYVHFSVTCRALVFCPTLGSRLTGVVTESFHSHLSLVVHHYFNASVPAERLRAAGFDFDTDREQWYVIAGRGAADVSSSNSMLSVGQRVVFDVEKVHESGGIISLAGSKPSLC